ncbi:MAG: hypothetical protein ACLUL2_07785 [Blautia sp.]
MINIENIEEVVKAAPTREQKLRMIADNYGLSCQMYKLMEDVGNWLPLRRNMTHLTTEQDIIWPRR